MRPSETQRGRLWLENFDEKERETAKLLVDGVRVAATSQMHQELNSRLDALIMSGEIETPVLLVPERGLADLPPLEDSRSRHELFGTYSLATPYGPAPGSEGPTATLVRNIVRRYRPGRAVVESLATTPASHDQREALREGRYRSVVILTDYIGSGNQTREFARTIVRNSTIRSWRSSGHLSLVALAFASTAQAQGSLTKPGSPLDRLYSVETAADFTTVGWNASQVIAVQELCTKHTPAKRSREALGYAGSRGLFATDVTVPNNLPFVLRRQGRRWHHFFSGRSIDPELLLDLDADRPRVAIPVAVKRVRHHRLARALDEKPYRPESRLLLAVLALLHSRQQRTGRIAARLGLPHAEVEAAITALTLLGLIDDGLALTEAGAAELRASKRAVRTLKPLPPLPDVPYYPTSLR
ncbi:hypothetical protein LGT39_02425 [Demequina sp. TTPB684]|uniref:phosphoribosyltransferase-like protein n=1 Tax=unclassified Demequina TaxID=2620311 RepID=UPI001CF584B2|nr:MULTISPECIES: hypothetical protein [unclassified Demequina]MCB2411703.1 hypothetical protein [Demequina sp. TTPB684]UPU88177.1 hypothetical protein LGT36_013160 [Demequina sp. TMPB413]